MTGKHIAGTAAMCSLIIVLGLSLTLNYYFITGKIRMEIPDEMTNLLNNYEKKK